MSAADGATIELIATHAVVIATGSAPLLPDIPGLLDLNPWTSRDATSAKAAPRSLAVLGGGVVGAEMATAFNDFGSTVTLIARRRAARRAGAVRRRPGHRGTS